jgi:hypothetical protein
MKMLLDAQNTLQKQMNALISHISDLTKQVNELTLNQKNNLI